SGKKGSLTYRGPRPFSAPETQAIRDFVQGRVVRGIQQIRTHITLHTNGQLILWPYGYTKKDIPSDMTVLDHQALVSLGRAMARTNGYKAEQSSDLYITDGDQIDWLYGKYRIFSYTFELFPPEKKTVWGDHYPDDSKIARETARNREAILMLIDRAACPYATLGAEARQADCGPLYDDLEINRGWVRDARDNDTATSGLWEVGDPLSTKSNGPKQLGGAVSGIGTLVTGAAAGKRARSHDVDQGTTSMRSRPITLPADAAEYGQLTFRYSFAHSAASTDADFFRVQVQAEDGSRTTVFERLGSPSDVDGSWRSGSASLADWAGQTIRLVVGAKDGGPGNLVEAQVDNIRIRRP
ncbi:MAG TPA: M14 family zinc carboxypeptidase, partial [Candidatus Limnocylindrales bacterium]